MQLAAATACLSGPHKSLAGIFDGFVYQNAERLASEPVTPGKTPRLSAEYEDLRVKCPQLNILAGSIVRILGVIDTNRLEVAGSGVLIDRHGTVVIDAHQISHLKQRNEVHFVNPQTGGVVKFAVELSRSAGGTNLDTAFLTITDPTFKYALNTGIFRPVEWAPSNYSRGASNEEIIMIGIPAPGNLVHATAGTFYGFNDSMPTDDKPLECSLIIKGRMRDGMSGGGAFRGNKFIGTNLAGQYGYSQFLSHINPSERVFKFYQEVFPERVDLKVAQLMAHIDFPGTCKVPAAPPRLSPGAPKIR